MGGGAVAISFADLGGQSVNSLGAVGEEIDRQLAEGIAKMKDGLGAGARQVATTMRLYASTVDDNQLQAALRKANRRTVVSSVHPNRNEVVQRARKLGIDPARILPHSLDRAGNEAAFDRLSREGLAPSMREVADYVDGIAAAARRSREAGGRSAGAHGRSASTNTGSGGLRQLQRAQGSATRTRGLDGGCGVRSRGPVPAPAHHRGVSGGHRVIPRDVRGVRSL